MAETKWTKDQQLVIDLRDRNILVAAAAGSGKTAVLVERIIEEITEEKNPKDIDKLLVVTFTKAAAAEMRTRIGNALELRIEENPDNEHIQKQASLLHLAQITTIDSFCQSIIKNYFHIIDLDPVFTVGDETELGLMKQDVLEEVLEQNYARAKEEKDDAFLAFTDIFATGRTDHEIEELVLNLYEASRSFPWPSEWLDGIPESYACTDIEEFEQSAWMKSLIAYLRKTIKSFLNIAYKALQICDASGELFEYSPAIEADIQYLEQLSEADSYHAFATLLASSKERKQRLKAIRNVSDAESKDAVRAYRDLYWKNGIDEIVDKFFFQSEEMMLEEMQSMAVPVNQLVKLTKEFSEAFSAKKREEGIVDFADMEHFALQILVDHRDGGAYASKTALELQDYYEEILTDEYQDSNYVQELLLSSLCCNADENMLEEDFISRPDRAPYLFMVGDVKQSIYRFRQARPDLFLHKYEKYATEESVCRRIDLHKNFRSRASVLEAANYIFEHIMTKELGGICYDEQASLVPGADFGECSERTADLTEVLLFDQENDQAAVFDKKEFEAAGIGQKIKELVQGDDPLFVRDKDGYRKVRFGDIAILLRSMTGWSEKFIEVLNEMGIPAFADTKTGYFTSMEVETVLNLLHVIDNPRQDIALSAVLRSIFCRLTDDELAWIGCIPDGVDFWERVQGFLEFCRWKKGEESVFEEYKEKGIDLTKWDTILKEQKDRESLKIKLTTFVEKIKEYRSFVQIHSVYELLRKIYKESGYYDYMASMPAGEKRKANLDILLQQSIEFESHGHSGIFGFTYYIESLQKSDIDFGEASIQDENTNAVRIMTIHKSKGLEFPVVFVAGMGKRFNMMDARKATIIDGEHGVGCDYINLSMRVCKPGLFKRYIANAMVLENLAEELRVLYVALTRAKEKLYITGAVKDASTALKRWIQQSSIQNFVILKKAQTYLDWIMTSLFTRDSLRNAMSLKGNRLAQDELYRIFVYSQDEIIGKEAKELGTEALLQQKLRDIDPNSIYDKDMHEALLQRLNYEYPYRDETDLPIKVSVSELKRKSYENALKMEEEEELSLLKEDFYMDKSDRTENDKAGLNGESEPVSEQESKLDLLEESNSDAADKVSETDLPEIEIPRPAFLQKEKEVSGTARGTLYHLVMEHFPYAQIRSDGGKWDVAAFQRYLAQMVQNGYMTQEEAKLLNCRKFVAFLETDIGKRMAAAQEQKTLRLEQPFMLGIPADQIYTEKKSKELIMVQGIIDAFFFEDEDIVLVDYKTDRVRRKDGTELVEKYKEQLKYYAQALERLSGRKVKEKIIYSFALSKEIPVE